MALVRSCACLKRQPFAFWTQRRKFSQELVVLSDEVSTALRQGEPVVALESTIITHGMPYPKNLSTATDVEATVRSRGAIPATVGVYQGRLHVGMGSQLLEELAKLGDKAAKISRRDLPAALSKGLSGGTTVSSTMVACNRAGIQVFVTGGIGGVHRGGESTLDISADLSELGRTPVAVISAGVKSILDIGRTLEFLETEGVCVAAFGDSQDFPSFFTSRSGHHAPWRVANASDAAAMIASRNALHLDSGILIAVPIPKEFEADGESVERAIELAAQEAKDAGITGNAVTPYILNRVNEVTGGASLRSNVALIKNNAVVGSDVAVALAELERKSKRANFFKVASSPAATGQPVVVGGSVVDLVVGVNERIQHATNMNAACLEVVHEPVAESSDQVAVPEEPSEPREGVPKQEAQQESPVGVQQPLVHAKCTQAPQGLEESALEQECRNGIRERRVGQLQSGHQAGPVV
ncbi:pseudouridine-metabolizing bifunctional protein C1861.05 [Ixodes scapularis]